MLLKDRQEQIDRQACEARKDRLAGRQHAPAKPSRIPFLSRR
jgi:hypothetical protein